MENQPQSKAVLALVYLLADKYRKRLMSISWFMKMLNENIARQANLEDKVTGSFYDLRPCKSHFVPPSAFKFDSVKFSGTVQQLKKFVENIKNKIKQDISLIPALE